MFTNNEKVDMLLMYGFCRKNSEEALRLYSEKYPERRQPNRTYFKKLEKTLRQEGSFQKEKKKTKFVTENENNILNVIGYVNFKNIEQNDVSLREIEKECAVDKMSARKILKSHKYKPYKIRTIHHINNGDMCRRQEFCFWLMDRYGEDPNICHKILWSDESRFTNNGIFNRQVHYHWSQENSNQPRITNFQERFGINIWIGILDTKVLYFFFNENLTAVKYLNFLQNDFQDLIDDLPLHVRRKFKYFQQDGAPAHNARLCQTYLDVFKPNHWIGTNGPVKWPARSPDLTPLDFFVWGFLKNKVYLKPVNNVGDLEIRILQAIDSITPGMLHNALRSITERAQTCIENNGGQFENLR